MFIFYSITCRHRMWFIHMHNFPTINQVTFLAFKTRYFWGHIEPLEYLSETKFPLPATVGKFFRLAWFLALLSSFRNFLWVWFVILLSWILKLRKTYMCLLTTFLFLPRVPQEFFVPPPAWGCYIWLLDWFFVSFVLFCYFTSVSIGALNSKSCCFLS